MSKRKSTSRAKLKTPNQEELILTWKEHFKNLLGKSPKVTNKPFTKIINNQLDIKLGLFMQEELDVVLRKIKTGKLPDLLKYHQKYGRQGNLATYCSDTVMPYIIRTQ